MPTSNIWGMNKSHFTSPKFDKLVATMLSGIEEAIDKIKPNRALVLHEKPADSYYDKYERMPPQKFYTEEIAEKIFEFLRLGMHEEEACAAALIPSHVVNKWICMGKKGIEPWQTFQMKFEQAIALAVADNLRAWKVADPSAAHKHILTAGTPGKRWRVDKVQQVIVEEKRPTYKSLSDDEKSAMIRARVQQQSQIVSARVVE